MQKDYNVEIQRLFLEMMLTNAELYTRVMNIMNAQNFDKGLRPVAEFMVEYSEKYSLLPDIKQISATTGTNLSLVEDFGEKHTEWFLEELSDVNMPMLSATLGRLQGAILDVITLPLPLRPN